jgi:hypothetical protein
LETAHDLARSRTVGTFIDDSLRCLEEAFAGSLVSFNRIDLAGRTAAVAFRPCLTRPIAIACPMPRRLRLPPQLRPACGLSVVVAGRARRDRLFAKL